MEADADDALNERLSAVAMLGLQRKAGPDLVWSSAAALEDELLAEARALAQSGGEGLAHRIDQASTARRPMRLAGSALSAPGAGSLSLSRGGVGGLDAGAAFARAFVLGSADASDRVAAQAAASMLLEVRAEARAACADALALAPNPAVGPAVARALDDAPAGVCAAALGVLRFRRQAPYAVVLPFLAHPDPEVAAAAARAIGTVPERGPAAAVLAHVLARRPDGALAATIAEVLLTLGERVALDHVRARLGHDAAAPPLPSDLRVAYLRLLALGGEAADRDLLFRCLAPTAGDAEAVGWFGHPDLVDWLLASLEAAGDARRSRGQGAPSLFETAAARALQRVLGSPTGAPVSLRDAPILDPGPWRAHWQSERARVGGATRLRFGRPHTPLATIDELEAETLPATRADAALELAILSRGGALLETGDWVARQRALLAAARSSLAEDAWPAGTFAGARLPGG